MLDLLRIAAAELFVEAAKTVLVLFVALGLIGFLILALSWRPFR